VVLAAEKFIKKFLSVFLERAFIYRGSSLSLSTALDALTSILIPSSHKS